MDKSPYGDPRNPSSNRECTSSPDSITATVGPITPEVTQKSCQLPGARTWHGRGAKNEAPFGASQLIYQVLRGGANKNRTCDLCLIRAAL